MNVKLLTDRDLFFDLKQYIRLAVCSAHFACLYYSMTASSTIDDGDNFNGNDSDDGSKNWAGLAQLVVYWARCPAWCGITGSALLRAIG